MAVRIIVDSTADTAKGISDRLTVVPMTITFGNTEYIDRVTIDNKAFYEMLETSDTLPVTSQATPFAFEEAINEALKNGDDAVIITVSAKLSGTYSSAVIAASEYEGRVYVVDSRSVSIGIGILAEYALSLVDRGLSAKDIAEKLAEKRDKIRLLACLDTLSYLARGGRISKAAAACGGMLNIKPVAAIEAGEIKVLAKARGTKMAFSALTKFTEEAGGIGCDEPFLFGYTGTSDENVKKYISENEDLWNLSLTLPEYTPIGSVVGTHAGPGAVAVAFFEE